MGLCFEYYTYRGHRKKRGGLCIRPKTALQGIHNRSIQQLPTVQYLPTFVLWNILQDGQEECLQRLIQLLFCLPPAFCQAGTHNPPVFGIWLAVGQALLHQRINHAGHRAAGQSHLEAQVIHGNVAMIWNSEQRISLRPGDRKVLSTYSV